MNMYWRCKKIAFVFAMVTLLGGVGIFPVQQALGQEHDAANYVLDVVLSSQATAAEQGNPVEEVDLASLFTAVSENYETQLADTSGYTAEAALAAFGGPTGIEGTQAPMGSPGDFADWASHTGEWASHPGYGDHPFDPAMAGQMSADMAKHMSAEMAGQMSAEMAGQMSAEMAAQMSSEMAAHMSSEMAANLASTMAHDIAAQTASQISSDTATAVSNQITSSVTGDTLYTEQHTGEETLPDCHPSCL